MKLLGIWPDAKLCVLKASLWQCPAWHGSDSAWHGVTESVTRPSVRLSPPFRLLLSSPHSLTTCDFAKLSEKCSVTVSKYSNAAIFKVQSLWGFPQNPDSTPALLESAACVARGMSQSRNIQCSRLTLYSSHLYKMFPSLVFCSKLPGPPIPWHPNSPLSPALVHRRHWIIINQTENVAIILILQGLVDI